MGFHRSKYELCEIGEIIWQQLLPVTRLTAQTFNIRDEWYSIDKIRVLPNVINQGDVEPTKFKDLVHQLFGPLSWTIWHLIVPCKKASQEYYIHTYGNE